MRIVAVATAVGALFALTGCGAVAAIASVAALLDTIDKIGGSGEQPSSEAVTKALTGDWAVLSYSGSETGDVLVPSQAQMRWVLGNGGAFSVRSEVPITVGPGATRRYDEGGTWRLLGENTRTLGLTVTKRAGLDVPIGEQEEVIVQFARAGERSVTLATRAIGPGLVTYTLSR